MLKVIVWLLIFTPLYVVLLRITHGVEFIVVLTMPVILAALGFSMWRLNRSDRDLGDTGASLPSKGWAGKNLKVKYADVEKIEISLPDTDRGPATGAIHIKSRTPHGTVATEVSSTEFESEAAMRSYAEALMRKVKASQPGRVVTSRPRPGGGALRTQSGSDESKSAAQDIYLHVRSALAQNGEIHCESFMRALGAVAGRSCAESARARAATSGETLDVSLAGAVKAVSSVADAGSGQPRVQVPLWDIGKYSHDLCIIGAVLPPEHPLRATPHTFADAVWPELHASLIKKCHDPASWPVEAASAIQMGIVDVKQIMDPKRAWAFAMESVNAVFK